MGFYPTKLLLLSVSNQTTLQKVVFYVRFAWHFMKFRISKRSKKSRARLGVIETAHGVIETPAIVGVATQGVVKTLDAATVAATGTQVLISNTYHLHLRPGEELLAKMGGLHKFMQWDKPIMTDSGGFQVFSLGYGRDYDVGKILKAEQAQVSLKKAPQHLKITESGVEFRSHIDGAKLFIGPRESMQIQKKIGADIIFAFDECTPPIADREYTVAAMERTHRWAKICLEEVAKGSGKRGAQKQALFGIVQGGKFADLRKQSAEIIGAMPFDGFGIGGEFGDNKKTMSSMIRVVIDKLPDEKPRHLLGIGHPEDIVRIIKEGVDTFDCTAMTHNARHGGAFTSRGRIDVTKSVYKNDKKPLDPKCKCSTCATYSRAYLCHLFRAKEMTAMSLVTIHNLTYMNALVAECREKIKKGLL